MANTLSGLVVTLGLNAVEFMTGLTKSEYQAKKFAQRLDTEIARGIVKAQVAMEAFGKTVRTAFDKAIVDVGNFKQIAEQIGDTAEAVASLDKAAATSGVSLQDIGSLSARLAATLAKTDDEGDKAAQALKAIGLSVADFRALAPVAQIEELARAMAQFGDSSGKTAVAITLLGKSGAQALPFLNDLADQGGRTVQITQQQIEAIDRYTKTMAAFGQELATAARIIASDFVQWLQRMQNEFREGINIAGSFLGALRLFGTIDINPLTSLEQKLGDVNERLREANALAQQGGFLGMLSKLGGDFAQRAVADLEKQRKFLLYQIGQKALAGLTDADLDARDLKARQRPFLNFQVAEGGKKPKRGDSVSDAQRYLDSLTKQIERTQDLTAVEAAQLEIRKGLKGLTPDIERRIILAAQELDFAKATDEYLEQRKKHEEDIARARQQNDQMLTRRIDQEAQETQAIRDGNQQIEDQITLLLGGEEALNKVNLARLDSVILLTKEKLLMEQNANGSAILIQEYAKQIAALERRRQLFGETKIAEQMRKEVEQLQDLKDSFSDALVQPLVDFVNQTKSAKDAFRSFLNSIQQMLTEKAARGLADYIFGGKTSGGFDFSTIFKLFSGFFGGSTYLPVTDAVPPVFGGFARGTSFAYGGRAWVGENGPELIDVPRGARVIPHKESMQMTGRQMVFNVNVLPGADTRSARQAGEALRDVVMRSIRER